ncbi:hypothetical protein SS50377_21334 [Spironucleus salmonicida]|nr:hypothetical protein SS50377_21330 [Spironucleus salmonicida]KAH0575810.1 hypothetical protein SS50377_21334 [Spironucleus salmonicida]
MGGGYCGMYDPYDPYFCSSYSSYYSPYGYQSYSNYGFLQPMYSHVYRQPFYSSFVESPFVVQQYGQATTCRACGYSHPSRMACAEFAHHIQGMYNEPDKYQVQGRGDQSYQQAVSPPPRPKPSTLYTTPDSILGPDQ